MGSFGGPFRFGYAPGVLAAMHPVLTLSFARAEAELEREVGNAHARWKTRRSVLVTIEDASGQRGRGEAAPLPGVSRESLDDVISALRALEGSFEPSELDVRNLPPSLRFAIESALLDLFLVHKASYEVGYEAANRPAWIGLPVRGLARIATRLLPNAAAIVGEAAGNESEVHS